MNQLDSYQLSFIDQINPEICSMYSPVPDVWRVASTIRRESSNATGQSQPWNGQTKKLDNGYTREYAHAQTCSPTDTHGTSTHTYTCTYAFIPTRVMRTPWIEKKSANTTYTNSSNFGKVRHKRASIQRGKLSSVTYSVDNIFPSCLQRCSGVSA